MNNYRRPGSFKSLEEFQEFIRESGFAIGFKAGNAALNQPISCYGRTLPNRMAVLPMEGWDAEAGGVPSALTLRRWTRFAESGAGLIFGTEACAVMHQGKSNPYQLVISPENTDAFKAAVTAMRQAHRQRFGSREVMIGLQLAHSGRYSHPNRSAVLEPRTAFAHPLLDKKFNCDPTAVVTDQEIREVIRHYIQGAKVAYEAGFDFVDVKLAHGYLSHELLSAINRPGEFGGSFENRTRFFREVAEGIKKEVPGLNIASRISIYDIIPFYKDASGVGRPMEWSGGEYPYAFGGDGTGLGMDPNLTETVKLVEMMQSYGVELICATVGSPYYSVHLQRPAYYAVADGYEPPEDPMLQVSRHMHAVARLKQLCPKIQVVGSGYTCLQEFLPAAAEYAVANGLADYVGLGRMMLSYHDFAEDVLTGKPLDRRRICRTLGECTNAPRHGCISGCYPLDDFYKQMRDKLQPRL